MPITERTIDQAYSDLYVTCGGVRNDYMDLLYLEEDFEVPSRTSRCTRGYSPCQSQSER